ncbi:MAG TPA: FadR/GntR family transcriptional regulator [Baekduia sp.]
MTTAPQRHGGHFQPPSPGASEQIAWQIRRYLEEQHLQPGDRLGTEQELADEFGVSRPTLREALRLLSASQLIRVGRGRAGGIFVARTPSEGMSANLSESIALMLAADSISLDELLDARLSLEVPLAGRAAANATVDVVARLEAAVVAAEGEVPGSEPFNQADTAFHQILAEAAGNVLLRGLTGWILEVLQPSLIVTISGEVDAARILEQHRAILRAVRRRQRAAAEKGMREHIEYLTEVLHGTPRKT